MSDVEWIRRLCLSLPEVTEDMPWRDDLCFKVRGKIFAGMVLSDGRFPRLTVKCAPETFQELLEIDGISIAPYVGRYNWAMLANSNVVAADKLEMLIRQSYELVAAKAPRQRKASAGSKGRSAQPGSLKRRPARQRPSKSR
ncbi:MAG: MmcQ/YjbR family DNA-binding protein [Terriglobales bacterium]|jgi:predicted DNA-binding protein (MmcQ/YjbR family)